MLRMLRLAALIVLCFGMMACARLPAAPSPETREEESPADKAEPGATVVEPAAGQAGEVPSLYGEAVQIIGTGATAVAERRHLLVDGGHAIGPDGVGYFMDVHEGRLLQSLGDSIRMHREGSTFRLLVAGRAGFDTGSSQLRDFLLDALHALAEVLIEFDNTLVVVHAHTDSRGETEFNQALSERRAMRVAQSLSGYGVHPARLVAVGHGERDPVADNETASGRAMNRRVEIVVETLVQTPLE